MLISEGEARNENLDRRLACILAAVAGSLNTAAFHAVGFFSANMTGNVSALSDRAALGEWLTGAFYLVIVLAFIGGASISTLLISAGRRRRLDGVYAFSLLTEAVLMTMLGGANLWLAPAQQGPSLILGLSFLMGMQNAMVTRISGARVRTTHVSGMATDIGIELSMLFDMARGREPSTELTSYRSKLRLHLETVLSFLGGGVAGVVVYRAVGGVLLFGTAALLFAISFVSILRVRRGVLHKTLASDRGLSGGEGESLP